MTQTETKKILALINSTYPSFTKERDPNVLLTLWGKLFQDEPYELVENGLLAFIATDTKGFPPAPGAIKAKIHTLSHAETPSEMEALSVVAKAVSRSAYDSKEEYAKLPGDIQRAVGSPDQLKAWSQMDSDEFQTVVASNFQRTYRARVEAQKELGLLPEAFRARIPQPEAPALPEGEHVEEPVVHAIPMPENVRDIMRGLFG